jgi:hypothetical protein
MRDRRRRWEVIGPGTVVIGPGTGQWQWRSLFEDLLTYQGDDWAGDVIDSWAQQHPGVIAELHAIGARRATTEPGLPGGAGSIPHWRACTPWGGYWTCWPPLTSPRARTQLC